MIKSRGRAISEAMRSMSWIIDVADIYIEKKDPVKSAEIKNEEADFSTTGRKIAYCYLNNWLGLTVSMLDCSLLVWRMAVRGFAGTKNEW